MTYEVKLFRILNAIQAARKSSINEFTVKLYTKALDDFDVNEIYDILYKNEQQEKVLKVKETPSYTIPHGMKEEDEFDHSLSGRTHFTLELLDSFDDWYNKQTSSQKAIDRQVVFDSTTGILTINDKHVSLQKGSFRTELLALIIKNSKKLLQWDDVIERILGIKNTEELTKNKNKFYSACDGLQKRIAQKTGINDFLIFTKSTVQLNPKYL